MSQVINNSKFASALISKRDLNIAIKGARRIEKRSDISLKDGTLKGFGENVDRSNTYVWYRTRDDWRCVLYSCQRLLQSYYKEGNSNNKEFYTLVTLLLENRAFRILAIDTALSASGGFTPGIDGKVSLSNDELDWFVKASFTELSQKINFDVKRVMIPKANGKLRPLGLPNIMSKCYQNVLLFIMEPIIERLESDTSFGFRKGRNGHMAILEFVRVANKLKPDYIINADIEKCFDMISHEFILKCVGEHFPNKICLMVKRILAGRIILPSGEYINSECGTPQGGVISPLLCNFILRKALPYYVHNMFIIRYADDINILYRGVDINNIIKIIDSSLAVAGLKLNKEKTVIHNTRLIGEFEIEFLGYNIVRKVNGKYSLRIPSNKVDKFMHKIEHIIKNRFKKVQSANKVVDELNIIIRGWCEYYRLINIFDWKKVAGKIDKKIWSLLYYWTLRQRTGRNKGKVINKYWKITKLAGKLNKWEFRGWKLDLEKGMVENMLTGVGAQEDESKLWGSRKDAALLPYRFSKLTGNRWDTRFGDWYKKGLKGYNWSEIRQTDKEGCPVHPLLANCFVCGSRVSDDIIFYAIEKRLDSCHSYRIVGVCRKCNE